MSFIEISAGRRGPKVDGPVRYRAAGKGIYFIIAADVAKGAGIKHGQRVIVALGCGVDTGKLAIYPCESGRSGSYSVIYGAGKTSKDVMICLGLSRLGLPVDLKIRTTKLDYEAKLGQITISLPLLVRDHAEAA